MRLTYNQTLKLKDIPQFTKDILAKLEPHCTDHDCLFDIRLSFEEALVNAIKHGNKGDNNKTVNVTIEASDKAVTLQIKDQGSGFDNKSLASPVKSDNLEKLSGRGVFLIKNLMDEVAYLDNGSRIRMVKYLKTRR